MPSKRPQIRLQDISENAGRILSYTTGMDFDAFEKSALVRDATERCPLRISEAATKLATDAEILLPNHPWQQIRSIGNVLRHMYDDVDAAVIWAVVSRQLPVLLADINDIVEKLPEDDSAA